MEESQKDLMIKSLFDKSIKQKHEYELVGTQNVIDYLVIEMANGKLYETKYTKIIDDMNDVTKHALFFIDMNNKELYLNKYNVISIEKFSKEIPEFEKKTFYYREVFQRD